MLQKDASKNVRFLSNSSTGGRDRIAVVIRGFGGKAIEFCDFDDEWTFVIHIREARVCFREPSTAPELFNSHANLALPTGRRGSTENGPRSERIRAHGVPD